MSIFQIIERGEIEALRELLSHNKDLVFERSTYGDYPLHYASWHDRCDMINTLLRYGADIEASGHSGWKPLHYAVKHVCPDAVALLIIHGADTNATTSDGKTPLDYSNPFGLVHESSIFGMLLAHGATVSFFQAICFGLLDHVHCHLMRGLEETDRRRADIIERACLLYSEQFHTRHFHRRLAMVQLLLNHGFIPNVYHQTPPLFHAIRLQDVNLVRLLLQFHADRHVVVNGVNAVQYAEQLGLTEIKHLLEAGYKI
jgi:ankyrin repeat protein